MCTDDEKQLSWDVEQGRHDEYRLQLSAEMKDDGDGTRRNEL
jgi:hypothetical protein